MTPTGIASVHFSAPVCLVLLFCVERKVVLAVGWLVPAGKSGKFAMTYREEGKERKSLLFLRGKRHLKLLLRFGVRFR